MNIIIGITIYRVFSVGVKSGVSSIKDYTGGIMAERVSTRVLIKGMLGNRVVDSLFQTVGACFVLIILFEVSIIHSFTLIIVTVICGLMAEGFMLNFAKIIRHLPDLNNIIQHTIQLLFFASPVLYGFELTSGLHKTFNSFNPVMYFIEFQRGLISESYRFNEINPAIPVTLFVGIIIFSLRGYTTIDKVRWELSTWS
jgi:ABC-type polysaccharide/polyol phosphate export permease